MQKKGQVTIPVEIRQKLGLAEGDLVFFIETPTGIMLSPQTIVPTELSQQRPPIVAQRNQELSIPSAPLPNSGI